MAQLSDNDQKTLQQLKGALYARGMTVVVKETTFEIRKGRRVIDEYPFSFLAEFDTGAAVLAAALKKPKP